MKDSHVHTISLIFNPVIHNDIQIVSKIKKSIFIHLRSFQPAIMSELWLPVFFLMLITLSGVTINWWKNPSKSKVISYSDQKSLLLFRILFPAAIVLAFMLTMLFPKSLIDSESIYYGLSIFLFLLGMIIRWTAILSLKNAFTVKVAIVTNHQLKTDGIYRYMRHPSYTGLIIYYTGLGISLNNMYSLLLLMSVIIWVILKRIQVEERILEKHFGDAYRRYQHQTKALFPGII